MGKVYPKCAIFLSNGSFNALLVFLGVLAFSTTTVLASDADILLEFQSQLSRPYHTTWDPSNVANLCTWRGIECDGANRVREIDVTMPTGLVADGSALLILTNLTNLVRLNVLDMVNWTGSYPQEIFQMPTLSELGIEGELIVKFPATINAPLVSFEMTGANFTGKLPTALNYPALQGLTFQSVELSCPLPQAMVDRLRATPPLKCLFAETLLWVDSNQMLCGQIHMSEVPCRMYPLIGPSPIFVGQNETSNIAAPLQYTATYKNLVVEFRQDISASFFLTYRSESGEMLPYREQYAKFNYYPLTISGQNESLMMIRYTNMEWLSPKKLLLNSTMFLASSNSIIRVAWIYEFDADVTYIAIGGVSIKFSIIMNRVNYTWPGINEPNFAISVTFRIPHAPEQGPPMLCQNPLSCASDTATWTTAFGLDSSVEIAVRTNLTEFVFGYGYVGTIDGVNISSSGQMGIKLSYYFSGSGFDNLIKSAASRGRLSDIHPPGRDQYMTISARLNFPQFTDFFYDPDINMRVLFDTSSPPPSTLPNVPADAINAVSSNTMGIAVGVTFTIVVVAAVVVAIVVYKTRRSRTIRARQQAQSRLKGAQSAESTASNPTTTSTPKSTREGASWKKAQPRESTM